MAEPPPKRFQPKVAASTPNPVQPPTRAVPQTAEAIARADAEKARQALAAAQAQLLKAAEDKGYHAGELAGHKKGRLRHHLEACVAMILACLIITGLMILIQGPMELNGRLAVANHEQARLSQELDATFNAPAVEPEGQK